MKILYLAIVTTVLEIGVATAQSVPSATAVQFVIIHQRNPPESAAPTRPLSDILLEVADTTSRPPVRKRSKPTRIKPVPADTWAPGLPGEEPDGWWPGIHIGPGPDTNRPRRYVPYKAPRSPRTDN